MYEHLRVVPYLILVGDGSNALISPSDLHWDDANSFLGEESVHRHSHGTLPVVKITRCVMIILGSG